jgi:hypothetical protein
LDQKPTAEIKSAAEGARGGGANRWDRECQRQGESALTERAQRQRGNGWLQGSEGV